MPKLTLSTTNATALTAYEVGDAVVLKTPATNSGNVWFGYSNAITAGTVDATDGMILEPGNSYTITPTRCGRTSGNIFVRGAVGLVVYYEAR